MIPAAQVRGAGSRRAALPFVVGAALLLAPIRSADAQTLGVPGSGVAFPVHRDLLGRPHTAVGTFLRRHFGVFKVYAVAFYVADGDGRPGFQELLRRHDGDLARLRRSRALERWAAGGDWGRALDFEMLRSIERGRMAGSIRGRLTAELGNLDTPDLAPATSRFFAAIDLPLRRGQHFTVVQTPGPEIVALLDGKVLVRVRHRRLAEAIWGIYFGPRPMDPSLRSALLKRVENLLPDAYGSSRR